MRLTDDGAGLTNGRFEIRLHGGSDPPLLSDPPMRILSTADTFIEQPGEPLPPPFMAVITARKVKVNIRQDPRFKAEKGDLYVEYRGDGSAGFSHYSPANFGSAGGRCVLEFEPELDSNRVETLLEANADIGRFVVQVYRGKCEHGVGFREQSRKHPPSRGMGFEKSKQKIRLRFTEDDVEQRVVYGAYTCVIPVGDPIATFTFMYDNMHRAIGIFGIPRLVAAGLLPPPELQAPRSPILIDDDDGTVAPDGRANGLENDVASESDEEGAETPQREAQDAQHREAQEAQQHREALKHEAPQAGQSNRKRPLEDAPETLKPKRTIVDLAKSLFCECFGDEAVPPANLCAMVTAIMSRVGLPDEPEDLSTRLHLAQKALNP